MTMPYVDDFWFVVDTLALKIAVQNNSQIACRVAYFLSLSRFGVIVRSIRYSR